MKVYIFYTDSHKILLDDFFLPSIKNEYNAELNITKFEQKCPSGRLNSNGWIETMYFKVDTILKGINENINKQNNIFIHSDIDIQFFGDFIKDCKNIFSQSNCDILFQKGGRSICMGFFICKANTKTKQFFTDIKSKMKTNGKNDEYNAKELLNIPHNLSKKDLRKSIKRNGFDNPYSITWNYLPSNKYINGTHVGLISFENNAFKTPPKTTIMHHATCIRGVERKIKQLEYVRDYFNKSII